MPDVQGWVLWGAAGHAKVLADLLSHRGSRVLALVDNDPSVTRCLEGTPILHGEAGLRRWLECQPSTHVAACAGVAIGGHRGADRMTIREILRGLRLSTPAIIHPSAEIAGTAVIGEGSHVLARTVVAADCRLGSMVIVNHGATVDHECVLADGVHVAPGATLCGCVTVDAHAMVGAGAVVLPRIRIGARAIVGAGAVVTRDVPADCTVVGSPAKPMSTHAR
ncbi:MAG: hypothetical protein RLZZ558_2018 [Planctomycetota bacterium]|jgi:sugar O-acyltransferase (sialic acid O-acetyltransferase NeuD family)